MRLLCAAVNRSALLVFAACGLALATSTRAHAQSEPSDPVVSWAVGYPRIEGGKMLFRGSVTLPNGFQSLTRSVSIHVAPRKGGLGFFLRCPLDGYHNFSGSLGLKDFSNPARDYNIIAFLDAISAGGRARVSVTARVPTLSIP